MADPEPVSGEQFMGLPSRKLLTDDLERLRDELRMNWSPTDVPALYPTLMWVAVRTKAVARAASRVNADDAFATEFSRRWEELDRYYGEPMARRWSLSCKEAGQRLEVLLDYLADSGPLGLMQAEPDSPTFYLTKEELGQ